MVTRRVLKEKSKKIRRITITAIFFTLLLSLLICRLFYIQLIKGNEYVSMVRSQQIDQIYLNKKSGNILDRNGISFTSAGEQWRLKIIPYAIGFNEKAYKVIESLTKKKRTEFTSNMTKIYDLPVIILNSELLKDIEKNKYPGVLCYKETIRYDDNSLARHVIGYLRKADNKPVSGIEKVFGQYLHPETESYIDVFSDAMNRPLFSMGYQIKESDNQCYDVQLTLDYNIQQILEHVLDNYPSRKHGGIVVDAITGDILALASRPHYKQHDPTSLITDGMNSSFLTIPFEQYPIGSVYKIIVSAAALESGKYNENSIFSCNGGIQVGSIWVPCNSAANSLETITLREAFAYSCNDTFIKIAQEIGGDAIINMSRKFGLGKSIEIELPNATGRLMKKNEYTGAGIANLAIGQGSTMVTPLQVADIITTILNGGIRKPLKLVNGLVDPEKNIIKNIEKQKLVQNNRIISQLTAATLVDWMGDVTKYGTAKHIIDSNIGGSAGKTGTPQVSNGGELINYGWFAGFFPVNNPKYIIVVLSLEGGAADMAVPVFQEIAEEIWLSTNK